MLLATLKCSARTLATAATACLLAATYAHSESAQKINVFTKFGGNWSGSGKIFLSNGKPENLRCKGGFVTNDAFNINSMKLDLRCANESLNFNLDSEMSADADGQISGVWTERTRGISGKVTGKIKDDQIEAVIESPTFTATMDLINLGDKQQLRITSPGGEMTDVLIGLNRLK